MEQKWNPWLARRLRSTNTPSGAPTLVFVQKAVSIKARCRSVSCLTGFAWTLSLFLTILLDIGYLCLRSFSIHVPLFPGKGVCAQSICFWCPRPGRLMFLLHLLSWNTLQLTEGNKGYYVNDCSLTAHFSYLQPTGLILITLHFACMRLMLNPISFALM